MNVRILHTIDSGGLFGAEAVLLTLMEEQRRAGDFPILMSIGNGHSGEKPLEAEAARRGLPCIAHRMPDGLSMRGARALLKVAARERADLIHSHGYKTNILLALTPRAARGRPVITTLHGWTAKSAFSKLGLYRFVDQLLLRRLDFVAVVSEKLHVTPVVSALGDRAALIPNGITPAPAVSADELEADPVGRELVALRRRTGLVIGGVGRLSAEKNFSALIEALGAAPARDARLGLAVLGDGPEMPAMRAAVRTHGLADRVLLTGYVADARRYLRLFDALAIPSLTEGLPMILLEALAQNVPVISTRVGEVPKVLGDLGELVEPGDVPALSSALARMACAPGEFRARAARGAERVAANYSARVMAASYRAAYLQSLARRAGEPAGVSQ